MMEWWPMLVPIGGGIVGALVALYFWRRDN
jgi:hypothetical protein